MAAGATYVPIATQTASGSVSSLTFSSIPQTYTDLVLILGSLDMPAGSAPWLQFNGDTGTNYSVTFLEGTGTTATSNRRTNFSRILAGYNVTSNGSGQTENLIWNIQNYSNSTTYKTVIGRWNSPVASYPGTNANVGLWRNTATITSFVISNDLGNFTAGSTFTLYGIASA
jgi:hypothetical protein